MSNLLQIFLLACAPMLLANIDIGYSCGFFKERSCEEKEIYDLIDKSYDLDFEGKYEDFLKNHVLIEQNCAQVSSQNLQNYCNLYFLRDAYYGAENLDEEIAIFKEFISLAASFILLPASSDHLDVFPILLNGYEDGRDITYEFIINNFLKLKPNRKALTRTEKYYDAIWSLTFTNLILEYEDPKVVIESFNESLAKSISLAESDDDYDLVYEVKLQFSEYLFVIGSLDQFYTTKGMKLLSEVLEQTNLIDYPNAYFRAWKILLNFNDRVSTGSVQENFLIRAFINNYFEAVISNNYYDVEIDQIFLDYFPLYFLDLDCAERYEAWQTFKELRDLRVKRFALMNTTVEQLEPWDSRMANRGLIMDCQTELPDNEFLSQAILDHKSDILDILNTPTENLDSSGLFYSWYGIERLSLLLTGKEIDTLYTKFNQKLDEELRWYLDEESISAHIAQILLTGYFGLLEKNPDEQKVIIDKMGSILELYVAGRDAILATTQDAIVMKIVTADLYNLGYKNQAARFYKLYFKNYKYEFINNTQNIFVGDEIYDITSFAMRSFLFRENEDYESILESLIFLGRSPIELGLTANKIAKSNVSETIEFFNEIERNKNEYVSFFYDSIITESELNNNIQEKYINLIKHLSNLSSKDQQEIFSLLYPSSSLKDIQRNINQGEILSFNFEFLINDHSYLTNILIDLDGVKINTYDIQALLGQSMSDYFYELEGKIFESFIKQKEFNAKELDSVSKLFLPNNINEYKKIIFITNFFDGFNSNLLRHNGSWLIQNHSVENSLSIANFLNSKSAVNKSIDKYLGIGDVDYSGHKEAFYKLTETRDELSKSSKFYKDSRLFFGKNANEESIQKTDFSNAVVHFATHTNNPFTSVMPDPSLVLSPSESEDGYLSVFEIANLKLDGSHIILAACDTDASITTDYDYFSGLVKSFVLSGASSLLATKWDIESSSAKQITIEYSKLLSILMDPQESIQSIQKKLINENGHPFIWSGYFVVN